VQAFKIFSQSIEVSSKHLTDLSMQLYQPEVIIAPPVGHYGLLQQVNPEELIKAGMIATEETLHQIETQANWMKKIQRQVRHRLKREPIPEHWANVEK
jgi:predicted acylesterase/phospholipase RssA